MSLIAIDIDDTLLDFSSAVREAFFEMAIEKGDKSYLKGAYIPTAEWRSLTDAHTVESALEAIDRVHNNIEECIPHPGSAKTCNDLIRNGHEIIYVSSRDDKYSENTTLWLFDNDYPNGELICSSHDKSHHLGECRFLIDDRPRTIVEFLYDYTWQNKHTKHYPRIAFGLWRDYNRALTDIPRVYLAPTWMGISYYLQKTGVIS